MYTVIMYTVQMVRGGGSLYGTRSQPVLAGGDINDVGQRGRESAGMCPRVQQQSACSR